MAGDWIKVQTCTPDKPEVHQLAEMLEIDPDAIVGKLIRIWAWADMHTIDGNACSVTRSLLDRITNVSGFADALSKVGWLESMPAGVHFTNFDRHNGETAKTRALTSKRVKKSRTNHESVTEEKRECNGDSVTKALPEKRREEKRENYIPGPDVVIPEQINTEPFREAIGRWIAYTRTTEKLNGKPIESNSMEEQELWRMVNTWKTDAESLSGAVSAAIVGGWANLRKPTTSKTPTKFTKFSEDFLEAVKAAQQYPSDYEKRLELLGPEKFEALKKTGTSKVSGASDSQLVQLGEIFDSHLKDIRNAVTAGN